jgi:photosystem II stability/assembly factor-like uncharacterized protein
LALAALSSPCQAGFQDPLDVPAVSSQLASRALQNGLALAGQRLVAVGQRGHIVYSDDEGGSWKQATVPVSVDLTAVFFITPKRGWAVGHSGVVLTTEDAGASWTKQLDGRALGKLLVAHYAAPAPQGVAAAQWAQLQGDAQRAVDEGPDKPFLDVWFENENTGYVVGLFNLILKTSDGGKRWTPWLDRTDNPKQAHIYAVRPVGDAVYLAGEQGLVLKLDRASERFKAVSPDYQGSFFGIVGKPGTVLVYGLRGSVYRSSNGGTSWQKIETGISQGLTSAVLSADGSILLCSQGGQVLVSSDEGASFSRLKTATPMPTAALLEVAGRTLVRAGARGIQTQALK